MIRPRSRSVMRLSASAPITVANRLRITKVSAAVTMATLALIGSRVLTESVPQHVAGAAHGVQDARLAAVLELAAQVRDEDVDGVRLGEGVVAPDLVEQRLARHDDARVAHQVLEQLELARGQVELALAAEHLARVRVEAQVADDDVGASARRAAPQQGAHAREQLVALERLDEIVVGARVEALDASVDGVAGGEDQDRDVAVLAQPPAHLDPVELGQGRGRARPRRARTGRPRRAPPRRPRRCGPRSPPCPASDGGRPRYPRRPRPPGPWGVRSSDPW